MKRILFVDDESRILDGIKRMLHSKRKEWSIETAEGADAALLAISAHPFDVVVSDMRMPGMDGALLLEKVKAALPSAARIILSGQADPESSMRAAAVAHQYLSKPCTPEQLLETLTRAVSLQLTLGSEDMQRVVSDVRTLPSPPHVFQALSKAMRDPEVELAELAKIVSDDVALCAKVLQLVNSSFFGLGRQISDMRQAISYLGLSTLKNVVLNVEVFGQFEKAVFAPGFDLQRHHTHAVVSARIARDIAPSKAVGEAAFAAGMLHTVGALVLAQTRSSLPVGEARPATQRAANDADAPQRAEIDLTSRLGAYLLGVWGLPSSIVEAVLHHKQPRAASTGEFGLADIVHVASVLARWTAASTDTERAAALDELDRDLLESLGLSANLPAWIERAAVIATPASE